MRGEANIIHRVKPLGDGLLASNMPENVEPTFRAASEPRNEDASVLKVAKSGGTPTVLATAQTRATSITVDATSIYWLDQGSVLAADGALRKLGK
jgi:hypothetical protein